MLSQAITPQPVTMCPMRWHRTATTMLGAHRLLLLVGYPGGGKSSFAQHAAIEATGKKPKVLQGNRTAQKSDLWGHFELASNETRFIDGPLPEALKSGAWLVVEDFSLVPLEVRSLLLALRGQDAIANPLTKELVPIPPTFRLIATTNPESLKCRDSSMLMKALVDDFMILEVPYQGTAMVRAFLRHNFPSVPQEQVTFVVDQWYRYYKVLPESNSTDREMRLSYRAADHLMKLLLAGMDRDEAVSIALANQYIFDEDAHGAAKLLAYTEKLDRDDEEEIG